MVPVDFLLDVGCGCQAPQPQPTTLFHINKSTGLRDVARNIEQNRSVNALFGSLANQRKPSALNVPTKIHLS